MKRIGDLRIILIVVVLLASWVALQPLELDPGSGPPPTVEERQQSLYQAVEEREQWLYQGEAAETEPVLRRDLAALYAAVGRYAEAEQAVAAGYWPEGHCRASLLGAQGTHYAQASRRPTVVAHAPQRLMYEPQPDGSMRFLGVEYLVFQRFWHDVGNSERPALFGETFGDAMLDDEPVYRLHVWIGQFNPLGLFADWNPLVSCAFVGAVAERTEVVAE